MRKILFINLALVMGFFSCSDDDGGEIFLPSNTGTNVFVLNEGNFQSANGSISVYNTSTGKVNHKVFQNNNSSRPLGDVVQSMVSIDDRYFIVVNNSSKIEVVNHNDFRSVGKLEGFNSPRYILPISRTKAYVSDLYQGKIYVINPQSLRIIDSISTGGWTEEMVLIDTRAFVCQVDSAMIYVYNTENDSLLKKIPTNLQPQHLEIDAEGMLWVSCSGGINQGFPALHRINPNDMTVIESLELEDNSKSIGEIEMNADGSKLLYLMNDVFELSINDKTLPTTPLIPANNRLFYGMGIHQASGEIYLSDAIDYLQKGVIYKLDEAGNELAVFRAGIIPGDFYFSD